jgi:lipopolysaccharide transport system ATP-binding protein
MSPSRIMFNRIITVENLSKSYLVGHESAQRERHTALRDVISREARNFARKTADLLHGRQIVEGDEVEQFWALKNLSFEVRAGELLGIVGNNGAGKSTLLKILSRIIEPSVGRVTIRGRVASLLEIGTGFHPELTGRENIFLNGAILGMTRAEMRRNFDRIVAFAEVERFLDTPIKRYSSGMYVRLAFAVAAHLEPEILIVDEVLAAGDAEFQKRCLNKMKDLSGAGRTLLFVSHNTTALRNLCSSGILLNKGEIVKIGPIRDVLTEYLGKEDGGLKVLTHGRYGPEVPAVLTSVSVRTSEGSVNDPIRGSRSFVIVLEAEIREPGDIGVFIECFDENHQVIFSTASFFERNLNGVHLERGIHTFECLIPGHLLNDGVYILDAHLIKNRHAPFLSEKSVVSFRIHDDFDIVEGWNWRQKGAIRPAAIWRTHIGRSSARGLLQLD